MAEATPTLTRDEIAVIFSREEAVATVEGLKHADATPGIPLRDSRHAAIGKVQAAIVEADKPPPENGDTGATGAAYAQKGASRDDTRAPLHVAKDKPRG